MDVDISDILAEASRPSNRSTSTSGPYSPYNYDYDPDSAHTDHQLLTRAWTSERCTPDLLPYPTQLMTRVMERVRQQISKIEDLTSGMADLNGNGGGVSTSNNNQNLNLTLSILQTDLSRTQFIVRSLLRQRLSKISKFEGFYYKKVLEEQQEESNGGGGLLLLSQAEMQFMRNHHALLQGFYDDSFLASFPRGLRRLDDSSGGVSMVEGPDMGSAVVVRCLEEDGWGNEGELGEEQEEEDKRANVEVRMQKGDVLIVRWRDVRRGVLGGSLELL